MQSVQGVTTIRQINKDSDLAVSKRRHVALEYLGEKGHDAGKREHGAMLKVSVSMLGTFFF